MLEQADFTLGRGFWTKTGCWRCTKIGTGTLCAIKLDGDPRGWKTTSGHSTPQAVRCARSP